MASNPLQMNVPADSTPPGLRPGTQLVRDHSTATFAKFFAQFDEPVTWRLEALDTNVTPPVVVSVTRSPALQREAMIHMHELYPSTQIPGDKRNYAPRLTITDPRGNSQTFTGASFTATDQLILMPRLQVTIDSLQHQSPPTRNGGTLSVNASVRVRFKPEMTVGSAPNGILPVPGRVVVAHVLRRPAGSPTWAVSSAPTVSSAQLVPTFQMRLVNPMTQQVIINPYAALPGDFLLSTPTDATGTASFSFNHTGLSAGDDVRLSIVAVLEPSPSLPLTFELVSVNDWDHPATEGGATPTVPAARDLRGLTTPF